MSVAKRFIITASIALILPLGACDSLRRAAGVEKTPPDEFSVVSRAPLDLPPDYTLRPPQAGAARPQETAPIDQARQTIFRADTPATPTATANRSVGEQALLAQAGAPAAPADIRKLVNQETTKLLVADRGFIDRLIFWKGPAEPGNVIDPEKEAQRLQESVAVSKSSATDETATIERKKNGLLGKIF